MGLMIVFVVLVFICPANCDVPSSEAGLRGASACYGTTNNFLELACDLEEEIEVTEVLYGAKLKSDECPVPIVNDNHPPWCCKLTEKDCVFPIRVPFDSLDPYMKQCAGKQTCSMRTTWLDTTGHCSDDYMPHTNYMHLSYVCLREGKVITTKSTTPSTAASSNSTTSSTSMTTSTSTKASSKTTTILKDSTTSSTTTITTPENRMVEIRRTTPVPTHSSHVVNRSSTHQHSDRTIEVNVTFTSPTPVQSSSSSTSSFAFTTGIMGGIAAAIIGLLLTVFGFLFYWGRRRRKLVTTKPGNSTVWDFLLAHTVAARTFRRGYDNFSNNRESVSSEGGADQTAGKQTWLPNIRVEPNLDTQSVTSDDNCSIVNINTLGSQRGDTSDRSEA